MRICINIQHEATPRLIEEDIEIALSKLCHGNDWEITEQSAGCFTADADKTLAPYTDVLAQQIKADTGAKVSVELIPGWPPAGWSP
ncbi:hypothetical protein LCGC14_1668330 [marine sediment metagenome]|uniref:Uncharacterized protein n=1 Tax=marine sediment metagenome TaxID=412755 RepID=A0A0F9KS38_9ZZZZ